MKKEGHNSPAAKQKPHKTSVVPPELPPEKHLVTVVEEDQAMNKLLQLTIEKLDGEGAQSAVMVIKELVDLKNRQDDRASKREFNDALAQFQESCPPIKKTSKAEVVTKKGGKYSYEYAELDEIARTVRPLLFHRGLSFFWDSETKDKTITCICRLCHRNGHEISSSFQAPIPNELGSMNPIQISAATLTYAKRQTLVSILGLTTADIDTDAVDPTTLDEKEIKILKGKAKKKGADEKRFFEYMNVKDYAEIRKVDLSKAALALDMYEKKEPAEKTEKPDKSELVKTAGGNAWKEKPEREPPAADGELNKQREKAYALLKQAADKKLVNRNKWEPIINNAKDGYALNSIISNLTAYIDEAGKDGKLEL